MHQHADYMLFFIIHAAFLPLLESIKDQGKQGHVKVKSRILPSPQPRLVTH